MIYLDMRPEVSVARSYNVPNGYDSRAKYLCVVTISHLSDKHVYLHGARGGMDKETWTVLLALLREKGVETVQLERRGHMKFIDLKQTTE